jgi:hypothetical protein
MSRIPTDSGFRDAQALAHLNPEQVEVEICRADEREQQHGLSSELDEMWSYVRRKSNPRRLWHAIDHHTGKVLTTVKEVYDYEFGRSIVYIRG